MSANKEAHLYLGSGCSGGMRIPEGSGLKFSIAVGYFQLRVCTLLYIKVKVNFKMILLCGYFLYDLFFRN